MAHNLCRKNERKFSRDIEVRKLPITSTLSLAKLLEDPPAWKKVMSFVRKDSPEAGCCPYKYTAEHIRMIEDAAHKQNRAATAIFLEEWGCSGRQRPTLGVLLDLLIEAQLYGAVDFISSELLEEPPPPRPICGPAAQVVWNDNDTTHSCFSYQRVDLPIPSAPLELRSLDGSDSNHTTHDLQSEKVTDDRSDALTVVSNLSFFPNEICESHRLGQEMETLSISHTRRQHPAQHIPYNELHDMTDGFNPETEPDGRLLGSGAFGSVFLGVMNDQHVAVKRLHKDVVDIDVSKHFFNEVEALSRIHHPHLLQFLGYSCDGEAYCLIYEYMSHGNLQDRLACKGKWKEPLSWIDRIKIGLGAAEGLLHLHSFKPPILHRDVKSSNILLDEHTLPKIGDFGLVRLGKAGNETHMVTTIIGTSAYMAPEAFRGDASIKIDVFSFGVVLLELLTGLPPYDEKREGCDLVTHVCEMCGDYIAPLLDLRAGRWRSDLGEDLSKDLYRLACKCLCGKRERPEMSLVVETLKTMYSSPHK